MKVEKVTTTVFVRGKASDDEWQGSLEFVCPTRWNEHKIPLKKNEYIYIYIWKAIHTYNYYFYVIKIDRTQEEHVLVRRMEIFYDGRQKNRAGWK
jgi:hypothetical protein